MFALTDWAGPWTGTNGFRLMPSDPIHEAPATAEVARKAGGNLVALAYTWVHPADGAQDGFLVLGPDADPGGLTALWGDSWHQSPEPRVCTGTVSEGVLTVGYEYQAGWRWVITVEPIEAGALRLQMDNVIPETAADATSAGSYPAMVMDLRRPSPPR